ncbi:MAG: helix-turn-helix transcriptional regulator [Clostridia bacterium]|nr:helix-turn-helix transcriptional regulator [Clostridia bacterium]
MQDFSEIAKRLRQDKGLTQTQLAQRMWVQKSIISAYETGMRQPSLDMIIRYAKEFHVTTDYLLGLDARKTLDISNLTEAQQAILQQLLTEFHG